LYENCQRQSCKAFIGLTIRGKIIGGGRPLLPEILDQTERVERNRRFLFIFARSASPVTSSEKSSINTIESPLRAFQ